MAPKNTAKATKGKAVLVSGEKIYVNDHVLVAAPWHLREGEPYMIARIMEFLPPASYSDPLATGTSREWDEDRLRVAYYLRQRDITTRYVADYKCILATMHSDVVPVSHIRTKCMVRHRDQINNLEAYKRLPDAFYWHQFYDRYLHRYFDAIPTDTVSNAPAEVVQYLVRSFDFVLCEVGTGSELTDASRGCVVCHKWAANNESVTCARCDRVFHLTCLDPPLPIKPRAGYSWSCAPCSKAHEEAVDNHLETVKSTSGKRAAEKPRQQVNGHAPKDKGKSKEVLLEETPMRLTNGWPFRYFGMHTDRYAVLDPHDSLYPRAKTRLGSRFQAVVGVWNPEKNVQEAIEAPKPLIRRKEKPGKRDKESTPSSITIARGDEDVLDIYCRPAANDAQAHQMDHIVEQARKAPVYKAIGVDLVAFALKTWSETKDADVTLQRLSEVQPGDFGHAVWSVDDQAKLLEEAGENGNDIETIAESFEDKTIYQVVKRYYMSVGAHLQDDVHLLVEEKASEPTNPKNDGENDASEEQEGRRPRRSRASATAAMAAIAAATAGQAQDEADDDEEKSVCDADASEKKQRTCATCDETKTPKWWRCPDGVGEQEKGADYPRVMCDMCGLRWRHYGTQYPPGPDELKYMTGPLGSEPFAVVKKEAPERKRKGKDEEHEDDYREKASTGKATSKGALASASTTARSTPKAKTKSLSPPPVPAKPVLTPKPCLLCKRMDPKTHLLQCRRCGLSAHQQCYGPAVTKPEGDDDWFCDLCDLALQRKTIAKHPQCALCPQDDQPSDKSAAEKKALTALDCLKPTESFHYVHLLCAIWHQELRFANAQTYQPVEGIVSIPAKRLETACLVCGKSDVGATVKCQDCSKHVHVACAWKVNYKFGFEVFPVKKRQAKEVTTISFRGESGSIIPCIWCPAHHFNQQTRKTYDIGIKDPVTKLTALETYVRSVKGVHPVDTFPLLRQAKRLDKVVESVLLPSTPAPPKKRRSTSVRALSAIAEGVPASPEARPSKKVKREEGDEDILPERVAAIAPWLARSLPASGKSMSPPRIAEEGM